MSEQKTRQNESVNSIPTTDAKKKTNENVNEVVIQGRLVHKYRAEKATLLTINTGRATNVPNYPKVVFFGDAKDEAAKYNVGDNVRVEGNIQSSKPNPKIKNQVTLSVFGESICAAETQLEQDFNVPGSFVTPVNHFKLAGTIIDISLPARNVVRITVKCTKNGRPSFVRMVYFTKSPEKIIAEHLPGNYIRVYGIVQTTKQEKNGEKLYQQSYIITEMC